MIVPYACRLLAMPGIVIHELAHYWFCCLVGARVHQVVYFSFGNPAGYVVHSVPRRLREHFAIVVGPFLLNSSLAFLLFVVAGAEIQRLFARSGLVTATPDAVVLVRIAVIVWLGLAIALQALPSSTDAASLWDVTG